MPRIRNRGGSDIGPAWVRTIIFTGWIRFVPVNMVFMVFMVFPDGCAFSMVTEGFDDDDDDDDVIWRRSFKKI